MDSQTQRVYSDEPSGFVKVKLPPQDETDRAATVPPGEHTARAATMSANPFADFVPKNITHPPVKPPVFDFGGTNFSFTRTATGSYNVTTIPSRPPKGDVYDTIVSITIAGSKKEYQMFQGLLAYWSADLKPTPSFGPVPNKRMTIAAEESEPFSLFYNWAYTGCTVTTANEEHKKLSLREICELYSFARRHTIPALQNHAINILHTKAVEDWKVDSAQLQYIYQHTTIDSKLRKIVIDLIARMSSEKGSNFGTVEQRICWPREAHEDMIFALLPRPPKENAAQIKAWDLCQYHEHNLGEHCTERSPFKALFTRKS